MHTSRHCYLKLRCALIVSVVCLLSTGVGIGVRAQQPTPTDERTRGITLYNQGNHKEAIDVLRAVVKRGKEDVSAWHYLGLALEREGKTNDARKAHENAAKLGEKVLEKVLESVLPENFSSRLGPFRALLDEAAESADRYLVLSSRPSKSKIEEWSVRAETLRDYVRLFEPDDDGNLKWKVYKPGEVTIKARILSRPEPQYTEEARKNQVTGTIVLRGVFASDGRVRAIRVVKGLSFGLTLAAIRTARRIKFVPAMRDGKPVSQYIQIEYNFNLY